MLVSAALEILLSRDAGFQRPPELSTFGGVVKTAHMATGRHIQYERFNRCGRYRLRMTFKSS